MLAILMVALEHGRKKHRHSLSLLRTRGRTLALLSLLEELRLVVVVVEVGWMDLAAGLEVEV